MTMTSNPTDFSGLGIAPALLSSLSRLGITTPTPIQHRTIPIGLNGQDLIGIAQTGTGKTFAFGIPIIQRLAQVKGIGLIIVPTRELAIQVEAALHDLGQGVGLRTAVLIGGASMGRQKQMITARPHVIIATPGRLIDHLEQGTLTLHAVQILVLDEADRMLDMGFAPQIQRILRVVPADRQTMLFSATMPQAIATIATHQMRTPVRVEIARPGTAADRVIQEVIFIEKNAKNRLLEKLLTEYRGTVLVFSRTKFGAKRIARAVRTMGVSASEIHSNRSLAQRREALDGFKSGQYRVLVATDIAARGLDVVGIELVINYDLPSQAEDYVHRIGRTGRAGMAGRAISFATSDQRSEVRAIEQLIRTSIPVSRATELPPDRPVPHEQRPAGRGRGSFHPAGRPQHQRRASGPRRYGR